MVFGCFALLRDFRCFWAIFGYFDGFGVLRCVIEEIRVCFG